MVFLIFGWGHVTEKNLGDIIPMNCKNCNNSSYFKLVNIKKWFKLFFIPVFPYSSEHFIVCPIYSRCGKLWPSEIDGAKKMNEATTKFRKKEINEKEYEKQLEQFVKKLDSGERPT